jgi:hypothetical protein
MVKARGVRLTPFAGANRIRFDGCDLSRVRAAPRCRQVTRAPFSGVRLLVVPGLVGIWSAASTLGGSFLVTAVFTAGAALLAVWAVAVLRGL